MNLARWFYMLRMRLRSLLRRGVVDRELDEELGYHLERQVEEHVERGMGAPQARRQALIALGGMTQRRQECRDTRGVHWLEDLGRDLLYGLRTMRRSPGFTAAALLILALGIGSCTAVLTSDRAMLFPALPYRDPGRLVALFQGSRSKPMLDLFPVAPANLLDWQDGSKGFSEFAAWRQASLNLSGGDEAVGGPERAKAAEVSVNLFNVLGVEPMLGRAFQTGEDKAGKASVAILSYGLWQRRYQGRREIVGQTIRVNGQPYTVIGVMRREFRFPIGLMLRDMEMWTPLVLSAADETSRSEMSLDVMARLAPGVKLGQARTSLEGVADRLSRTYPESDKDWGVTAMPFADRAARDFREMFGMLSGAVGLVLLIACANVANLLLARGMERQKELTVRTALGARRGRLVRQLMAEGLLLSLGGGVLGIGVAYAGVRVLTLVAPPEMVELRRLTLNMGMLGIALGLSLLTGLLFSVLPALALSGRGLRGTKQEGGRASTEGRRGQRLKAALVVGEVALTLVLLCCASDILNSLLAYMRIDPGFDVKGVTAMRLMLPEKKYHDDRQRAEFVARAVEQIGSIPGVSAAAAGSAAPMEQEGSSVFRYHTADGRTRANSGGSWQNELVEGFRITPDYFRATGMRPVRGRGLLASDGAEKPAVVVVNETFARKEFGDGDALGRRIFLDGDMNKSTVAETSGPPLEIVGVVRDTKDSGLFQDTPEMVFAPFAQGPEASMSLVVRSGLAPQELARAIRIRLVRLDSELPVYNIRSMEQIFNDLHAFFRFHVTLLTSFAGIALVLSMIGIYGVVMYGVNQRTREFGIRLALGAPRQRILMLVLREGVWMSVAGIAVGAALAWPAVRLLRGLEASISLKLTRMGPVVYLALGCGMIVTMLLAMLVPAHRATQAAPVEALRAE